MDVSKNPKMPFLPRFNQFVGILGCCSGILLLPVIFAPLFSMGPMMKSEVLSLWVVTLIVLLISVLFILGKKKISAGRSLFYFSFLILLFIEISTRIGINIFASEGRKISLGEQSSYTYPLQSAYTGHPFTQFVGQPNIALKGTKALGKLSPFNNFGYVGKDFNYTKPIGVIRVACLGESTTADGYPQLLENYLNNHQTDKKISYEVMNFGHAYWTTEHSMITFLTTVVDFKPDYVIIHHGWNEEHIRGAQPDEFRGDYSHALKSWEIPWVYDRYLIRASVIYRFFKFKYDPNPDWVTLGSYIQKKRNRVADPYGNTDELKPFRRNIETEIQMAILDSIKVVLTTLPHSTDETIAMYEGHTNIDQCNVITKEIAAKFLSKISFVDLDSAITGKHNEFFIDLGHITDEGRKLKAELIGKTILNDR